MLASGRRTVSSRCMSWGCWTVAPRLGTGASNCGLGSLPGQGALLPGPLRASAVRAVRRGPGPTAPRDRELVVVTDYTYAALPWLAAGQHLIRPVTVISRMGERSRCGEGDIGRAAQTQPSAWCHSRQRTS